MKSGAKKLFWSYNARFAGEPLMDLRYLTDIPSWEWPENAGTLILDALNDRNAPEEERLVAADLAGDIVVLGEKLADSLLSIVRSGDEPVDLRATAALSLGPGLEEADLADGDDDPCDSPTLSPAFVQKIQKTFHRLYCDAAVPTYVRRAILEASVRNPQSWHADVIRIAYDSNHPDWKLTSVFCMRFIQGFEKQILEALKSANPDIHYNAVAAAGNWEVDSAWPHIKALVTSADTEKSLRLAAIEAAASIRPGETDIFETLVDSEDEDISEAALDALTAAEFAEDMEEGDDEEDDFEDEDEDDLDEEDEDDEDGKIN